MTGGAAGAFDQLDFSVRGGVAGFLLDLTVTADGSAVLGRRGATVHTTILPPARLAELETQLAAVRSTVTTADSGPAPEKSPPVADAMRRELRVETSSGSWSILDPVAPPARVLFETLMEITIGMQAAALPGTGN